MNWLNKFSQQLADAGRDSAFLHVIGIFENLISKILSLAMIVVIISATYDLSVYLFQELSRPPLAQFSSTTLIQIFGLFLNILVALEILENITAYLRKHVIQVELVIVTSLIAVARKLIILDLTKVSGAELIGLSIAIFALSVSYLIIRSTSPPSGH